MDTEQLRTLVAKGIITSEQSLRIAAELESSKKDRGVSRFIATVSVIGAACVGIGAILLVALNWNGLSDAFRILVLAVATLGTFYAGYWLRFEQKAYPKVGEALMLLGAILLGVSIFLIAQIYNVRSERYTGFFLLWLIGILPAAYAFKSKPIAVLSAALYCCIIGTAFLDHHFFEPPFYFFAFGLLASIILFALGSLHSLVAGLSDIGTTFRRSSLAIAVLSLFLLTFNFVMGGSDYSWWGTYQPSLSMSISWVTGLGIVALLLALACLLFKIPNKREESSGENAAAAVISAATLCAGMLLSKDTATFFIIVFNALFLALCGYLIWNGYRRADVRIADLGTKAVAVYLVAKYIAWCWNAFPNPYLFFLVGGAMLILGGFALERHRKHMVAAFAHPVSHSA